MNTSTYSLLLFFKTVIVVAVSAQLKNIVFPPQVLDADLFQISEYYNKGRSTLTAYIHWPESITFRVRRVQVESARDVYLKIDGVFQYRHRIRSTKSYDSLYYRNSVFYVKINDTESMQPIQRKRKIHYVQTSITETKPYVSIRYFGVKELTLKIDSFFSNYQEYYYSHIHGHPSTYLVTLPNPDMHFVEYFFWSDNERAQKTEGRVRILVGKECRGDKLEFSRNIIQDELMFDVMRRRLTTSPASIRNVFGVRITNAGFIAEVLESGITMFSNLDFFHVTSVASRARELSSKDEKLLEKVKMVGLRYPHFQLPRTCPEYVKFQVHGFILLKSVNYLTKTHVDLKCPFVVQFEDKKGVFLYKNRKVKKLCTNDSRLWPK